MLDSIIYFLFFSLLVSTYLYIIYDVIKENNKWIVWTRQELHISKDILNKKSVGIDIFGIKDDMNILLKNKNVEDEIEGGLIDTYADIIKKIENGKVGVKDFLILKDKFEKWYVRDIDGISQEENGYIKQMMGILGSMTSRGKENDDEVKNNRGSDEDTDEISISQLVNMVNNS